MKIIASILFLFGVSLAQAQIASLPQVGATWQNFAPAAEEFSIESPGDFFPNMGGDNTKEKTPRGYHGSLGANYFYAFSDSLANPLQVKFVLNYIKQPTVQPTQENFYSFADADGFYHYVLVATSLKRIYTFQFVSLLENDFGNQLSLLPSVKNLTAKFFTYSQSESK